MNRFASTRSKARLAARRRLSAVERRLHRRGRDPVGLPRRPSRAARSATTPMIVTSQSTITRRGSGSRPVSRSTGLRVRCGGAGGFGASSSSGNAWRPSSGISAGVVGHPVWAGGGPAAAVRHPAPEVTSPVAGVGGSGSALVTTGSARPRPGAHARAAARARRRRSQDAPSAALLLHGGRSRHDRRRGARRAPSSPVVRRPGEVRVLEAALELGREALELAEPAASAPGSRRAAASRSTIAAAPRRQHVRADRDRVGAEASRSARRTPRSARTGRDLGLRGQLLHDLLVELAPCGVNATIRRTLVAVRGLERRIDHVDPEHHPAAAVQVVVHLARAERRRVAVVQGSEARARSRARSRAASARSASRRHAAPG